MTDHAEPEMPVPADSNTHTDVTELTHSTDSVTRLIPLGHTDGRTHGQTKNLVAEVNRETAVDARRARSDFDSEGLDMKTRVKREIASAEAAFGAAVADLAALLERAGAQHPYDDARTYVEGLQHDGWRYRPREHAPSRPPHGSCIPAAEHAGWQRMKERVLVELTQAKAEFEARETGHAPEIRDAIAEKPTTWPARVEEDA